MFDWLAKRAWEKGTAAARLAAGQLEAAPEVFILKAGTRYRATVTLTGFETWASNGMIEDKFRELGFKDPRVQGSGGKRKGEAVWPGPQQSVPMPIDPHLSDVAEAV
jgi:hypothetical protein